MLNREEFEKELKEIIANYKKNHEPISLAVKDVADRYNVSVHHVYNYIDMYLREADDSHMSFKGNKDISEDYVERRFQGE